VRILLWHVHGSWTTAFVQGSHDYVVPVLPDRGPDGRGRARTWDWPSSVAEAAPAELRDADLDLVVLQRPHELDLAVEWTGRRPGRDLPAVYVEHNTPGGQVPFTRHPLADQPEIPVVHVTQFNRLFWDCGSARTLVVEHGVVDPGYRYTGDLARAAVVVNEPLRRGRAVGADLLAALADTLPVDLFGMGADAYAREAALGADRLRPYDDIAQSDLHRQLARRRVYVHTARWTSLGLSLVEAMHLGMPVVAVAATEAVRAVPPGAGTLVASEKELVEATGRLLLDPDEARDVGRRARLEALRRYGLKRFLDDWEALLEETVPVRR
jgi:glycosyltransferase involved in cell wall biosynthesis